MPRNRALRVDASAGADSAAMLDCCPQMRSRRSFLAVLGGAATVSRPAFPQVKGPLKIVSVEAVPVRLWSRSNQGRLPDFEGNYDPRRWRFSGPFSQLASAIVVTIKTDQGITGYGLGAGGAVAAEIVRGHLRHLLVGTDPLNVELLWEQMYSSGLYYGRRGVFVMALSGIDNALWDIVGKYAEMPVHRLIGGARRAKVPGYITNADPGVGLELGFQHFKIGIRDGVAEGSEGMRRTERVLAEARQAIGPDRTLMIDCGCRWNDIGYTLELAQRLEPVGLYFIEEPLSPDNILGYRRLVDEVDSTLIVSGEHEYTHHGYAMLLHHGATEILQPDISWCGGLTALRKIASMGAERGLPIIPHRGSSLYGMASVLTADAPLAESFGTGDDATDLMLAMSSPYEDGHYFPNNKPGFGTAITDAMVREHVGSSAL